MRFLAAVLAASFLNLVIATPGMAAPKKAKKSKPAATTQLEVTANVNDATVMLDDDAIGRTPLRPRAVAAKAYMLTVKKLGYLEFKQRINVTAGQTLRVNADLMPFAGVIHVTSNFAGAQVAVDGKVGGTAPLAYEVRLGNRVVSVTSAGFPAFTQVVRASPGETYELRATFGSKSGEIATLPLEVESPVTEPPKGGELVLVPLEAPPAAPSMELPLEPVGSPATPSLVPPLAPPGDAAELALEMPGVDTNPQIDLAPLAPPMMLNQQVPPATKPWYREWWAYAAAGGVAAIAITSVILMSKGHNTNDRGYDVSFAPNPPY